MWDNFYSKDKKYWFDPEVRSKQEEEISTVLVYLNHLLEENVSQGGSEDLKVLLCEYIVNATSFKRLMEEVQTNGLKLNKKIDKEQYLLDGIQTALMRSQANLIMSNDLILYNKWGINLTVQ
jgi:hypothetical protein|tara:strand:+ start:957 stop:1322 length:366 start_codon:yes stop_codon:yes gene_type:complete